jgi:hypothetical protein
MVNSKKIGAAFALAVASGAVVNADSTFLV